MLPRPTMIPEFSEIIAGFQDSIPSTMVLAMLIGIVVTKLLRAKKKKRQAVFYSGGKDPEGRYHGKGRLQNANGNVYKGQFAHGKFHGEGEFQFSKANGGGKYTGAFRRGEFSGKGVEVYPNGTRYEGNFAFGVRDHRGQKLRFFISCLFPPCVEKYFA